uniref:DUF632 domain-containing protein n=1 Tax=Leersia perrieri TaxID=77586 RepID=A0A0D9VCT5_9ORYZ
MDISISTPSEFRSKFPRPIPIYSINLMGCSSSKKVEEEEAVKSCHDRRSFVKKAIAERNLLASSHVAYVHSLRRVSLALFYYLAEDNHLYFLQDSSPSLTSAAAACQHRPCSPETKKVAFVNCLRSGGGGGGAPVYPLHWESDDSAAAGETATVEGFFVFDPIPASPPAMTTTTKWDFISWDPFSSIHSDHQQFVNYDEEDEQMPELEEESDDDGNGGEEEEDSPPPAAAAAEAEEEEEVVEEELGDCVSKELRVVASAEIEQQSRPGFTVYVDRPPASVAEAMKDIHGHFMKVVDVAGEVSALLEVVPYQRKVRPPAPMDDGDDEGGGGGGEVSPEPFEIFRSHKESLDRLYEWEKRLYEEVKAGERVRLSYEKKCAQLRSQDANGAEPFAIEKTRAAIRDLRAKLDISITSVNAISMRIAAVRDDELFPQLMQLIRGWVLTNLAARLISLISQQEQLRCIDRF